MTLSVPGHHASLGAPEGASTRAKRDAARAQAVATLGHVRAVVMLGGMVRASDLARAIDRSLLDLPLYPERTLLDAWCEHAAAFGRLAGLARCPLVIRLNEGAPKPAVPRHVSEVDVTVETDASAYRGSGGVLRDIAQQFDDDDYLLTVSAAQVMLEPLSELAVELAGTGAPLSLVSHRDGTPSGVMLLRCGVLKQLSPVGFVDFKEQALPRLAQAHDVRVLHCDQPTGLPVRTLAGYITSLQVLHRGGGRPGGSTNPFAEDWQSTFALVEAGAEVAPTARIHDSVVLKGGRVGEGTVLVRAVVGPGGVVSANRTVVDRVVDASGQNGKRGR